MPATCNWSVRPNQVVFLTYSQATAIDVSAIQAHLDTLGSDHHVVGHEHHADGADHYHAIAHFGDVHKWRDARVFDVGGVHPNVDFGKNKGSVGRIFAYCTKDGDYYASSDETKDFFDALSEESSAKQSRNDIWREILDEPTADGFWSAVRRLAPYDYATRWTALSDYVAHHYSREPYVAPDVTWAPSETLDEMNAWVDDFLV